MQPQITLQSDLTSQIVEKARSCGATLAGVVRVAELRGCPSVRAAEIDESWLKEGQSVLVLALEHSLRQPDLDWWGIKGGTPGNQRLKDISERLKAELAREFKIKAQLLKYQAGALGVYLKDAAVLSGLGTIGANNLLITPQFGPRIRLRGLLLEADLPTTPALEFSPCATCDRPCWQACPQHAFRGEIYDRLSCRAQMRKDEASRTAVDTQQWGWVTYVKYCRACELACPLGDYSA